jgi:hypothetical protein
MATECKLSPDKLGKCMSILERTIPALEFAKQCLDCGYPVQDQIDQLIEHAEIAQKTKNTFFPVPGLDQ